MKTSSPILLTVTILIMLLVQACLPIPPAPTQDLSFLGTAIMQTMIAGATQTSQAILPTTTISIETATPLPTSTPEVPTATPTITLTFTPVFTATPAVPQVSVSVATNCRVGPGRAYDRVGALLIGQVAEVIGRNQAGNYWYIREPSRNVTCWLWGEYATVTGNIGVLPVYTPPPTPTPMPSFVARYDRLDFCTGWWVEIDLTNNGGLAFESVALTVRDTATNVVVSQYSDSFTDLDGCTASNTTERVLPGTSPNISSAQFGYDPRGHELIATVTLCSQNGQNGTCLTQATRFTP